MSLQQYHAIIFLTKVLLVTMTRGDCSIKNVTCNEIQNSGGYSFPIELGNQSIPVNEIEIKQKEIAIAEWEDGKCNFTPKDVHSCDNKSITTRTCSNVRMKYIHKDERGLISESCLIYITADCSIKNVTCNEIQNSGGYSFPIELGNQSIPVNRIEIKQKEIAIAKWEDGKCNFTPKDVHSCDNKSITTRTCSNVRMKYIHKDERGLISESCLIYITAASNVSTGLKCSTFYKWANNCNVDILLWVSFGIIMILIVLIVLIALDFIFWRRKQKKKGRGGYRFVDYLHQRKKHCPCKNNKGNSNRQVDQSDGENLHNYQLENLLDGKSDNTESNGGIADFCHLDEMKNDAKGVPQVSEVLPQKNGNMGHDPGGGKEDTKRHCNGNSTLEPSFNSDMDNGRLSTHKQGNGNPTLQPSLICDMDNRCLSTHKQGSAEKEATDETAGDKCLTLVDSLGPGINSNEPPDGDEDAHHKA